MDGKVASPQGRGREAIEGHGAGIAEKDEEAEGEGKEAEGRRIHRALVDMVGCRSVE